MDRESTIKEIEIDYLNELEGFLEENFLLDENYFIDYKLKGLQKVIDLYEETGGFFQGNDEFEYGKKSSNRKLFGYYFLYRKYLYSKKDGTSVLNGEAKKEESDLESLCRPTNDKADELFNWLVKNYRRNEETKVKFVNILHYLKNDVDKNIYIFNLKQAEYADMIKSMFNIEIKKFAKSAKYMDEERSILNSKERDFRKA